MHRPGQIISQMNISRHPIAYYLKAKLLRVVCAAAAAAANDDGDSSMILASSYSY